MIRETIACIREAFSTFRLFIRAGVEVEHLMRTRPDLTPEEIGRLAMQRCLPPNP